MNLCRCGCGQDAGLWPKTYARLGVKKGDPRKYINGHRVRRDMDQMYVVDAMTGCWNWTGKREDGYARLGAKLAYRLFYERAKGLKPEGFQIDHKCRNRGCVNPEHLEAVTPSENVRRAWETRTVQTPRSLKGTFKRTA